MVGVCDLGKLNGKKLLILGGISAMLRIVDIAHQYGILVYVTDYDEESPCKKVADKAFNVNAIDVEAVVSLIKREGIDGIITGYCDSLLPYYAEICEKAGIHGYATKEQITNVCSKDWFNDACKKYDVPVPKNYTIEEVQSGEVSFPIVVKPVDNSGSRGFSVCSCKEDVPAAISTALSYSKVGRCLIQEYLPDETVLLQYYIQDGVPVLFGLSDQYKVDVYEGKSMIGSCEYAPSKYTEEWITKYNGKFVEMLKGIGLTNGPCEIECWLKNGKIHVGDIGYRMCGGRQEYYYKDLTGAYLPEMLIDFALTGNMADCELSMVANPNYSGGVRYGHVKITLNPGRVCEVKGYDILEKSENVLKAEAYIPVGFEVHKEDAGVYRQLASRIFFKVNQGESFIDVANKIFDTVDFIDEYGNSMKVKTNEFNHFGIEQKKS